MKPKSKVTTNAAIALVVLAIAFLLSSCSRENAPTLMLGSCFDDSLSSEMENVSIVNCSEPHTDEVFAMFEVEGSVWPGTHSVNLLAEDACIARFEPFVGVTYENSQWYIGTVSPNKESWENSDDRGVICTVEPFDGTVVGSAGKIEAVDITEAPIENYYVNESGTAEATLHYVRWIVDHNAWVPGHGVVGLETKSLTEPAFREQWIQHYAENWLGNPEIEASMVELAFEEHREMASSLEQETGVSPDQAAAWLSKLKTMHRVSLNPLAQEATEKWTNWMVERGIRFVMVGQSSIPASKGGGTSADHFLLSTGQPEEVINDVFDLFSYGQISPENAEWQLKYLHSYSPELFDTLTRSLLALGMYKEGDEPTPGISRPDAETIEAYFNLQIMLIDMNRERVSKGGDLMNSKEMKESLIQDQVAVFRGIRVDRETMLSSNLIADMTSNIVEELQGRGWNIDSSIGAIEATVRSHVTEEEADRPVGSFRERMLATEILGDYFDTSWGQKVSDNSVTDLITYMIGDSTEEGFREALIRYSVFHGDSDDRGFTSDELTQIVSDAYRTSERFRVGPGQQALEESIIEELGMSGASPAVIAALQGALDSLFSNPVGVQRSRIPNV
jgi:hypothetical protein